MLPLDRRLGHDRLGHRIVVQQSPQPSEASKPIDWRDPNVWGDPKAQQHPDYLKHRIALMHRYDAFNKVWEQKQAVLVQRERAARRAAISRGLQIRGFAIPYGQPAFVDYHDQMVQIAPNAFSEAIRQGAVRLQMNHEYRESRGVLAAQNEGTLRLVETAAGVFFSAAVVDEHYRWLLTQYAELNAIAGVSPAWKVRSERLTRGLNGVSTIERAELTEISIITSPSRPAFSATWAVVSDPERERAQRQRDAALARAALEACA